MAEDRKTEDDKPRDEKPHDGKPGDDTAPQVLEEPGAGEESHKEVPEWEIEEEPENPWMRGLWMVVLAILFGVGQSILFLAAVLQFLWLVFAKEKNEPIAEFGKELADWLARVALFQTGATEDKPFPFARWGAEE